MDTTDKVALALDASQKVKQYNAEVLTMLNMQHLKREAFQASR